MLGAIVFPIGRLLGSSPGLTLTSMFFVWTDMTERLSAAAAESTRSCGGGGDESVKDASFPGRRSSLLVLSDGGLVAWFQLAGHWSPLVFPGGAARAAGP